MTRYFMRDTPLHQMEQQMMTPPNFKPRGHGQYHPSFRYKPEDVACQYCRHYDRKQCSLDQCPYLPERVEAGVLDLYVLLKELFSPDVGQQLRERMKQKLTHYFLNDAHRKRWTHWRNRYYKMSDRNKAALFLLTAYEDIWLRIIWKFDESGFDFQSVRLSGIQPELYSVYQAAKAIATGSRNITTADLASPELVTDEAFQLITCALILAKYGDVILNLERKTGDIKQ